jgi:hypothetical protein
VSLHAQEMGVMHPEQYEVSTDIAEGPQINKKRNKQKQLKFVSSHEQTPRYLFLETESFWRLVKFFKKVRVVFQKSSCFENERSHWLQ